MEAAIRKISRRLNRSDSKQCYYQALAGLPEAGISINQEESMFTSWMRRHYWVVALVIAVAVSVGSAKAPAPELNPAAISYKLPNQVNWVHGENGADTAILAGDPSKPGMYIVVTHFGKQVHYDGAKDEDVTLVIAGEGPATQTPAEVK